MTGAAVPPNEINNESPLLVIPVDFVMVKDEEGPISLSGSELHQVVPFFTSRVCPKQLLKSQTRPGLLLQCNRGITLHNLLFLLLSCLRHEHWEPLIWRLEFSGSMDVLAQPGNFNVLWHSKGCQTILPNVLLTQPLPHC